MTADSRLILAINPGSTSTKIAVYENEKEKFKSNVFHNAEDLAGYVLATDQYELRKTALLAALREAGVKPAQLSVVVGRGGILPPVKSGAYRVNALMVDRLRNRHLVDHASNLGAVLAYEIAQEAGVSALIYDSVGVDELSDIARISGLPELPRKSRTHALNMRAAALKMAQQLERPYPELNLIVAHLGGGISVSLHLQGQMADIVSDDEGALSPERSGKVPCRDLAELCYSGRYDKRTLMKRLQGNGGLLAYLGTNDAQEVERRIAAVTGKPRWFIRRWPIRWVRPSANWRWWPGENWMPS